jgi:dephospho-CoA kinase
MLRVGLTGNAASGKSTVGRSWARRGAHVIDADVLARRAVAPGTPGLQAVAREFGPDLVGDAGLDREALRRLVFADPAARERLERIVHPEVGRLRQEEEARLRAGGAAVVVHDIPLLFEVGLEAEFHLVVLVTAPERERARRLTERGLSAAEVRGLMASQAPPAESRRRADMVISNDGGLDELDEEAGRLWRAVIRRASRGIPRIRGEAGAGMRVDMHVHTRLSFDCLSRPDAVVGAALARGLDRLCITDHNEIEAALELVERFPNRVIPGEEVKTREGVDVIGLYLTEWIPRGTPARETCERIREQGGLVYVPHPFAGGKGGGGGILDEIVDLVDIVEGFNARLHRDSLNRRARDWARERGLPVGAGSDAHTLREIGNGYVELPPFNNDPASFLAALGAGSMQGRESSRLVHLASTLAKLLP